MGLSSGLDQGCNQAPEVNLYMSEISETASGSVTIDETIPTHSADGRQLAPAARRALAEAAARRAAAQEDAEAAPAQGAESGVPSGERGGPKGPEPTRYGDWERKGIAVDF